MLAETLSAPIKQKPVPMAVKHVLLLFLLAPVWWLTGLDFIIYPAVMIAGFFVTQPGKADAIEAGLLSLALCFFISLCFASFTGADLVRLIAAGYNASLILMGYFAYQRFRFYLTEKYKTNSEAPIGTFGKYCTWLLYLSGALLLIALIIHQVTGTYAIQFKTLIGMFTPPSESIIGLSQKTSLLVINWYGGEVGGQRYYSMGPYASAGAILFAIFGTFALIATPDKNKKKRLLLLAILIPLLVYCFTRSVQYSFIFGTLIAIFFFQSTRVKTLLFIFGIVGLLLLFVLKPTIINDIANYRGESTSLRLLSYAMGFQEVMETNPFFGLGIKPKELDLHGISTGSHSTISSSLTKGGLIGFLAALITFYIVPALAWIKTLFAFHRFRKMPDYLKREGYLLIRLQCVIWLWVLMEDIDAPAFAAFCIFLSYAYFSVYHERVQSVVRQFRSIKDALA